MTDPAEYIVRRQEALELLARGDPKRAFEKLRWAVWYVPGAGAVDPSLLADASGALSRIVVALGHRELAEAFARASTDPGAEAWYALGYELIEAGLPAIAATALFACLELEPGREQVITELVAALEQMLLYGEARRVLQAHPPLLASSLPRPHPPPLHPPPSPH